MLKIRLLLVCGLALWGADATKPVYKMEYMHHYFKDFVTTYNKQYRSETEKQYRLKIFTNNVRNINNFNAVDTAVYDINMFSDLTTEEFLNIYTGFKNTTSRFEAYCNEVNEKDLRTYQSPDTFDWRSENVVSPVKNQGHCGSCYAFSCVGNIESIYAIKNGGQILDLSEQQLVDCSKTNQQCQGGWMTQSMIDIIDLGGLASEETYPYVALPGACRFQPANADVKLSGCNHFNIHDENRLKDALFENGPLSIALASDRFQSYHGGILSDCPGKVNHAVLLIGYGSDNGQDFWTIKNSWGTIWGEQGFIRIARGQNTCNLLEGLTASAVL